MRVRSVLMTAALSAIALGVVAPAANAGGGCHAGPTTGTGPTVAMVDACFSATITHVDPGTPVTFVNEDPMTHNVTANLWGNFEPMAEGDRFSVTFDEEGVYPFACSYHPGMSGAIVVGDGEGAGNGEVVEVASPTGATSGAGDPSGVLGDTTPVTTTAGATTSAWGWLGGAVAGVLVGVAIGAFAMRRRSTDAR